MLSFTHTLISLPFGVYLQHPLAIFLSAFVFHLLSDTLLHWNIYPDNLKKRTFYMLAALDVLAGLAVAWVIMGNQFFTWPILLAIFAGNLPDILQGLWDLAGPSVQKRLPWAQPFFDLHDKLQLETKDVWPGLFWQFLLLVISLAVIIKS